MKSIPKDVFIYVVIVILCSFFAYRSVIDHRFDTAHTEKIEQHKIEDTPIPPVQSKPVKSSSTHRIRPLSLTEEEKNCLAENIYHEARGEGTQGMLAVAYVTLNRTYHRWFPNNVCEVVRQRNQVACQFSWVCNQDNQLDTITEYKMFEKVHRIVNMVVNSYHKANDPTGGALFFHNTEVEPTWKMNYQETARIQNHIFYKPN